MISSKFTTIVTISFISYIPDPLGPYRRRYDLYTHSFLYYGGDQFWLKALRSVADTTNTTGELVPHPCINTGNIVNIENTWKVQVNLAGAHNPTACRELVRTHVSPTPCWSDQCSLAGTYTPPIPEDQPFYLFSSFPSVLTTAGMTIDEPLSVNQIDNYASTVPCNLNWSDMLDKFPQPHNDTTYLTRSCVSMMYISVLLGEGYKFPPDSKQLHFVNKVGDNEVYWALGCILYEANMLDWDQVRYLPAYFSPPSPSSDLLVFTSAFLLFIGEYADTLSYLNTTISSVYCYIAVGGQLQINDYASRDYSFNCSCSRRLNPCCLSLSCT